MPTHAENEADEAITVALEFAELKMTIKEMIDHVWLETHLMMGSQRARLLGGLIEQPDGDQIERIAKNSVVIRFLESELKKRNAQT